MEWDLEWGGAEGAAIALAILFGALLAIIYVWNQLARRHAPAAPNAEMAEMYSAMLRLQDELPDLLQRMNSRLDAKMQALRDVIGEADRAIEELRRAASQIDSEPDPTRHIAASGAAAANEKSGIPSDTLPATEPVEHHLLDPRPPDTADLRLQRYAHVYSLADSGLDPAEISSETGMHRGEVELVLNLRRKRVRVDRGNRSGPTPAVRSSEEAPA